MLFQNILSLGLIISVCSYSACPVGWTLYEDSCYLYSDSESKSWGAAQSACFVDEGQLVEIESAAEKTFLINLRRQFTSGLIPAWIGLHDRENEGTHIWVSTGKVATYTNWGTDEPNDNDSEACVLMHYNGLWSDLDCMYERPYFCERLVDAICPPGWTFFRRDCYIYMLPSNHLNAESECIDEGGHLIEINSAAEDRFLFNLMMGFAPTAAWIELDDRVINGTRVWVASRTVMSWLVCVQIEQQLGLWTTRCTFIRDSVCERPVNETCQEGWTLFNRSCYRYSNITASWDIAQAACRGSNGGGSLAEITTAAENAFLVNLRNDSTGAWIGLNRINGTYIWEESENVASYLNWASGEPNNHDSSDNCVEMYPDGKWYSQSCTPSRNWFCEQMSIIIPY